MSEKGLYLGDSVYATCDGFMIRLYTDNGFGASNEIFLEPQVYDALVQFAKRVWTPDPTPEVG